MSARARWKRVRRLKPGSLVARWYSGEARDLTYSVEEWEDVWIENPWAPGTLFCQPELWDPPPAPLHLLVMVKGLLWAWAAFAIFLLMVAR